MRVLMLSLCLLSAASAAPQLLTAKDGQVGVSFGGYEAHANLGGFLNGGPGGSLGAGASTPYGQKASAGLSGNVQGSPSGSLYASAQASPDVGKSVVLSGSTDDSYKNRVPVEDGEHPHTTSDNSYEKHNVVQKIKPPKKYHLIQEEEHETTEAPTLVRTEIRKRVKVLRGRKHPRRQYIEVSNESNSHQSASDESTSIALVPKTKVVHKSVYKSVEDHPTEVHYQAPNTPQRALDIPIGILASLQKSLGGGVSHDSKCSGCGGTSPVDVGLNIPIGILQSLQQSLGGLGGHRHH